jgi:hypothetical protein
MRFFASRVGDDAYTDGRGGAYFVSSEQDRHSNRPRLYTIRYYDPARCSIETIGKFQQYGSLATAKRIAKRIAEKSKTRKRGYRMERLEPWQQVHDSTKPRPTKAIYRRFRGW